MAVAVDGSSPARFAGTPADNVNVTSASFTAPANSFLVCCVEADSNNAPPTALSITVSDSGGLTWTAQERREGLETTVGGESGIYTAPQVTSASRTVSVKRASTGQGGSNRISAKVYVLTGVDLSGTPVDTVGANNEGGATATPTTTSSITPGANGLGIMACTDWNVKGPLTSTDFTEDAADYASQISVMDGYKTTTSGVGMTANLTSTTAGPQFKWCQNTIRESAAAGQVPYQPWYQAAPIMGQ